MALLQAVQADGGAAQASLAQAPEAFLAERETVGDHPPGEAFFVDPAAAGFEVGAHQRLPAGDDDEYGMRLAMRVDAVQHPQEVFQGHVGHLRDGLAVAAAVAAGKVATQGALPEELLQRMGFQDAPVERPVDVQGEAMPQVEHPTGR